MEQNTKMIKLIVHYLKKQFSDNMTNCAKFIVEATGRRDIIDEDYILSHIDSDTKMQRLLDVFVYRYPSIQADAIIEDIARINKDPYYGQDIDY